MEIHKKTWPELFQKVLEGKKNVDLRLADFDINEGDILILEEYNPETKEYTGREIRKKVKNLNKVRLTDFHSTEDINKFGHFLIELESDNLQSKVKKFNEDRDWGSISEIKDLMLNMNEEIGEMWHVIKWVDAEKQKELIEKNKEEVGNFIGDMSYLLNKIAFICNVNLEDETIKVLDEYEKRMPIDKIKLHKHGNKLAGGWDNKEAV